ncbi:Chemotaxis protein methyltransferase 1 [Candidatus Magnetaquicoccaceae bacterium FCR-1]|uniref:protein-glutamate O-methyltransferase n=1 Tax=Candidatus Magnetaquiglobus chichijimensis TaxID=3141448 RepID=A0ABQ0C5D5_9PROT
MAITQEEFDLIRHFINEHSGIQINPGKEYLIENRLTVLLVQNGCENFIQLHDKLKADTGPLRAKVIDAMTTNETLWFRDDSFASALSDHVVPMLVKKARTAAQIRIWSAACSTGQEPYSVAMLIHEELRKVDAPPPISKFSILATDLSPSAIVLASSGRYSQLAISRGMRPDFLERYFKKNGMVFEVVPEVRNLVKFQQFNLMSSFKEHGMFDFLMCRNVLIYFSDELKRQIYGKMHDSLNKDGVLAIGASESPRGYTTSFQQVMMGSAAMYKPS